MNTPQFPKSRSGRPPSNMKNTRMRLEMREGRLYAIWRGMEVSVPFPYSSLRVPNAYKAVEEVEELMQAEVEKYYEQRRKKGR